MGRKLSLMTQVYPSFTHQDTCYVRNMPNRFHARQITPAEANLIKFL